jgi:uridine kinase
VRALLDVKVYVDAAADLRLLRRLGRDLAERGRSVESVVAQYVEWVRPMHVAHVEPTRAHADLVLCGEALEAGLARLVDRIDVALEERMQHA